MHALLRREGWIINQKKMRRICDELGLKLKTKRPKRRAKAKLREDRREAVGPNDVWAMRCPAGEGLHSLRRDFVQDQLATGRNLRVLTVIDTYSR